MEIEREAFIFSPNRDSWTPLADVYRSNQGWIIKLDAAGIDIDETEVVLRGSCLEVTGARKDQLVQEFGDCIHYSMEISYTPFLRKIGLPCSIEDCLVEKTYNDGMLIIRLLEELRQNNELQE